MTVSVLVPWAAANERRTRIWDWMRERWSTFYPEYEIVTGQDNGKLPMSRAQALNDAYRKSSGDLLLILDADMFVETVREAEALITEGGKRWVSPRTMTYKLNRSDSDAILEQDPSAWRMSQLTDEMRQRAEVKVSFKLASPQLLRRADYLAVNGFDERFRGWGGEDTNFAWKLQTILGLKQHEIPADCLHLWHGFEKRSDEGHPMYEGQTIGKPNRPYQEAARRARKDKHKMRELAFLWGRL